ncbi:MAG: hypothetical protein A2289_10000 [Deltaproteobacteria bacterium RIFOXYA12_FULL_58_15]|nr:MAG: hypothetical protein A2289_10000 [Deltaproteobacteria bacterium RIFOXYA12_FULL_58_15]OGR07317.1 MAG: hypothetical protein A2341_03075 [Deltaproteobacteria bacterium RIFOXYB12_FULL_58_9]
MVDRRQCGYETNTVQIQTNRQDEHNESDSAYLAGRALLAQSFEQHQQIASHLEVEAVARRRVLVHTFAELMSISRCVDPRALLNGRIKSIASTLGKMFYTGAGIHQLLDIIGIRVIFRTTCDCYRLVSRIHDAFAVLEQEYNDYIASPKPNGYQSIHTTVVSSSGFPVEIQIRTEGMHLLAERGSASHLQYKKDRVLWMPVPPLPKFP